MEAPTFYQGDEFSWVFDAETYHDIAIFLNIEEVRLRKDFSPSGKTAMAFTMTRPGASVAALEFNISSNPNLAGDRETVTLTFTSADTENLAPGRYDIQFLLTDGNNWDHVMEIVPDYIILGDRKPFT